MPTKIELHCWQDGPTERDGCSTTCFLEAGHSEPHKWTRDDQIRVSFPPKASPRKAELEHDEMPR